MPDTYPVLFVGCLALHEYSGAADIHPGFQRFDASLWNDWSLGLHGVKHEGISAEVEHYSLPGSVLPEVGQIVFISGTFKTNIESDGTLVILIRTIQMHIIPGNLNRSEDYIHRCPQPAHSQATLVGLVKNVTSPATPTRTHLRSFELNLSVWDSKLKSVPIAVVCMFPQGKRFDNWNVPRVNSLVSVTGALAGIHEETNCPIVLLQEFGYIRSGRITTEDSSAAAGSVPQTPTKSKWGAWAAPSPRSSRKQQQKPAEDKGKGKRPLEENDEEPAVTVQVKSSQLSSQSPSQSARTAEFISSIQSSPDSQLRAESASKKGDENDDFIEVDSGTDEE